MAVRPPDRRQGGPRTPCSIGRGLGEGECGRARRRRIQSRAQTACFQRLRLACRGIARLIPKRSSVTAGPGTPPTLSARTPWSRPFRSIPKTRDGTDRLPTSPATTAIAYPNGPPHMRHAYEAIATDAIARFMRLDGYDVLFLTGTDEHGIKMLQTAAREKLTPQQLVERNVPRFQEMVKRLNCSNDEFIRTTEERHHRASIGIWQRMEAAGDIYLGKYSGWYSVRDEAYYDEEETRLNERGERVGPQGTPVEWVEEESYFFRLSGYEQKLLDLYERHPDFVLPKKRLNAVTAFVKG